MVSNQIHSTIEINEAREGVSELLFDGVLGRDPICCRGFNEWHTTLLNRR